MADTSVGGRDPLCGPLCYTWCGTSTVIVILTNSWVCRWAFFHSPFCENMVVVFHRTLKWPGCFCTGGSSCSCAREWVFHLPQLLLLSVRWMTPGPGQRLIYHQVPVATINSVNVPSCNGCILCGFFLFQPLTPRL